MPEDRLIKGADTGPALGAVQEYRGAGRGRHADDDAGAVGLMEDADDVFKVRHSEII